MEYFRFTLFNCLTLSVMALPVVVAVNRWRGKVRGNWALCYYAVLLGSAFGFRGGLDPAWVLTGVAIALGVRYSPWGAALRCAETGVFVCVLWRCLGLILLWW